LKTHRKAYIYALSAIGLWSTIGSAFKLTLRYTDPAGLLMIASLVSSMVLLMILIFQQKSAQLKTLTIRQILHSALLGFLNPFLYYLVLLKAYDILPAQMAGTLNYVWPLALVILSVPLLKQKISAWSLFAILISFAGIVLISWQGDFQFDTISSVSIPSKLVGVALAVGSAIFWSLYWIFNIRDNRDVVGKLFLNFSFGLLYIIIYQIVFNNFSEIPWQGLAGGIYIGLFEMGITFVLWLNALKYSATTAKVSNLIYLSPFISLIFIHFTIGETITAYTLSGLSLIVAGILLQQYLRK
jgi:drug/metabolite transporter (DMT)-like permease